MMQVTAWKYDNRITTDLVASTLQDALTRRGNPSNVIVHSNCGSQYTSEKYRDFVRSACLQLSYSRKGNPYDNTVIGLFHSTLKKEMFYSFENTFKTLSELKSTK